MNPITSVILTFLFVFSFGEKESEEAQIFTELDGPAAELRDQCLEKNSMKVTDLKTYNTSNDIPEKELCFYKCFYEGVEFIDANGNLNVNNMKEIPAISELGDEVLNEITACVEKIGKIRCCGDLRKIEQCYQNITM
ncbi:uncharacterized protein LOC103313402 [Tribolium castaneum]|uniref:uncharacterized protein LOC103313402 n=1 Tax=Tribolium castaneum TaxID=7070 RepID=UPI0001C0C6E1|nr:PREDICTED: uncharacterized protein LOC103313402 isoform X2 [Tribolium castaneum]|eukprot:XP_015836451.1 PREDICTED: uncharacterized protein LOC103313402 isoform X2 [Tribolium castaneum]